MFVGVVGEMAETPGVEPLALKTLPSTVQFGDVREPCRNAGWLPQKRHEVRQTDASPESARNSEVSFPAANSVRPLLREGDASDELRGVPENAAVLETLVAFSGCCD